MYTRLPSTIFRQILISLACYFTYLDDCAMYKWTSFPIKIPKVSL